MRVNISPRRKPSPRPAWKVEEAFKQFLRGRECYLNGRGCGWGEPRRRSYVEAAHVPGGDAGMGTKASDHFCIPLCQRHHDEQHGKIGAFSQRGGWKTFQLKYGFDAVKVAAEYWRLFPGDKGELA